MDKPQRILAIETSSPRLSLAVGTAAGVIKHYEGPLEWRHADSLFGGMKKLLAQVRWPVQSLTGVLVSIGPGSFTGIRIGLAAARALGQGLRIPVVGISSLPAIAADALRPGKRVCATVDALRGEVFAGVYEMDSKKRIKTLCKENRIAGNELLKQLKALGKPAVPILKNHPKASALFPLGAAKLLNSKPDSYQRVVPLYLRSASAVERRQAAR